MDQKLKSLYDILEIDVSASEHDIRKAYKKKAKEYHPDLYIEKEQKLIAEKKFKELKEAYDYLILLKMNEQNDSYNFTGFYSNVDDDYDEFIKHKKPKEFDQLQKIAINFVEQEIKKRNMSIIDVYELIAKNKIILNWELGCMSSEELNDCLVKESLYRRYIKSKPEYIGYLKHRHFFHNLDTHATLIINPKLYNKKKFEEKVYYNIASICNDCFGEGCGVCHQTGVISKQHSINIKVPISNQVKFYEIKNGGKQSSLINGRLVVTVKYNRHLKTAYNFNVKHDQYKYIAPVLDSFDWLKAQIIKLYKLIITHKHFSLLYFLISILIIIIICLATLL